MKCVPMNEISTKETFLFNDLKKKLLSALFIYKILLSMKSDITYKKAIPKDLKICTFKEPTHYSDFTFPLIFYLF